jgi:hypothetical protein
MDANEVNKSTGPLTVFQNETGKIGYLIAWLMGVPASVLLIIFLIRGH